MSRVQEALGHRLDASLIRRNLYMGSRPHPDNVRDFDVIVLCAGEYQPASSRFLKRQEIIRVRLLDAHLTQREARAAFDAAMDVADAVKEDRKKVLVTCNAGSNRSGLVTAMALGFLDLMVPAEAIMKIREKRILPPEIKRLFGYRAAMQNEHYNRWLRTKFEDVVEYVALNGGRLPPWI